MDYIEALDIIYHWRHAPDLSAVPPILAMTRREGLLEAPQTRVGWSGAITALCDKYPQQKELWRNCQTFVINEAFRIARGHKNVNEPTWADYLAFRWVILATDRDAWALLIRAHHKDIVLAKAAQKAIESICMGVETHDRNGRPVTNSQGTVQGTVRFEDLRRQMMVLNEEFRKLTWTQRLLPFDLVPFSTEYRLMQRIKSGLLPVSKLIN